MQQVIALATAGIVFAVLSAGALFSLALGHRLPEHHLDHDSRDVVRLVAGFLATLSALVLGLLVASAKANFDEHRSQLHRIAADIVALDRTLARYGEGARETRNVLRSALVDEIGRLSPGNHNSRSLGAPVRDVRITGFYDRIQALAPQTDGQRAARDRAAQLSEGIAATRVLMSQASEGSIPSPFLLVLVFWLAAMFVSFGLFARVNATVITSLIIGAASVAGAMFLILELDHPLEGFMQLSLAPLKHAVAVIGP